ncbi:MAG TPA: hypothetical protein VNA28_15390, partial [Solirubrobacteraceae bacterium]|nr:hypothetical protein [Solirubrobacteraceae bacterium]
HARVTVARGRFRIARGGARSTRACGSPRAAGPCSGAHGALRVVAQVRANGVTRTTRLLLRGPRGR